MGEVEGGSTLQQVGDRTDRYWKRARWVDAAGGGCLGGSMWVKSSDRYWKRARWVDAAAGGCLGEGGSKVQQVGSFGGRCGVKSSDRYWIQPVRPPIHHHREVGRRCSKVGARWGFGGRKQVASTLVVTPSTCCGGRNRTPRSHRQTQRQDGA